MSIYIGRIDVVGSYYNFSPLYIWKDGYYDEIREEDYKTIIPRSIKHNINLAYNPAREYEYTFMEEHFSEHRPMVLEVEFSELEENLTRDGSLNQTAYKIDALQTYNRQKIKPIEEDGFFRLIRSKEINPDSDLHRSPQIILNVTDLSTEADVYIDSDTDRMYIGPYTVSFREYDKKYVAISDFKKKKYILSGYNRLGGTQTIYPLGEASIPYIRPNKVNEKHIDVIDDETLLESFKEMLDSEVLSNGKLDLSDTEKVVTLFKESPVLLGISDEGIRTSRLNKVIDLLKVGDVADKTVNDIVDIFGDSLVSIIRKYGETNPGTDIIGEIISANPDILALIQNHRIAQERLSDLQKTEEKLKAQIDDFKAEADSIKNAHMENAEVYSESIVSTVQADLDRLNQEKSQTEKDLEELKKTLHKYEEVKDVSERINKLEQEANTLEGIRDRFKEQANAQRAEFDRVIRDWNEKVASKSVEGYIANKLQVSAADWKEKKRNERYANIVDSFWHQNASEKTPEDLAEYLYHVIKTVRPEYDANTITNIAICISQGMLTVFAGEPGSGKTSICNIFAQALGLVDGICIDELEESVSRYIQVSVERGWTSKKDLIGYYNPLTKTFEQNNSKIYDALQVLSLEEKLQKKKFPTIVLLDEANLSPIEYYWADFMNVCDDLDLSHEISIGGGTVLQIPETLHFVATINNDYTTEALSPRLIDRASVITLPYIINANPNHGQIDNNIIERISWKSLQDAFVPSIEQLQEYQIAGEAGAILSKIKDQLSAKNIILSPRADTAIKRYLFTAEKLLRKDADYAGRDASVIALDYAIAQRVLPKINGYGEDFLNWLQRFGEILDSASLIQSHEILALMIAKGNESMGNYQFFA